MKIHSLRLDSFRSFVATELRFEAPRVLIVGVNGAGKSTIREAVKYALTGRCQGLDGKGGGTDLLVPTGGASTVGVTAILASLGNVTRTWNGAGATLEVDGMTGDKGDVQRGLYEKLGGEAFLNACLDSGAFLGLHHADAKALILALLNVKVTVDDKIYSLEQLDAAHAKAFDDRKVAKKVLTSTPVPTKPADQNLPTVERYEARLTEVRGELETKQRAIGTLIGRREELEREAETLRGYNPGGPYPDDLDDHIASLDERLGIMVADLENAAAVPVTESTLKPGDDGGIRFRAGKLKAFTPKDGCVLDSGIKCPVAKLTFTNRAKDLLADLEKAGEQVAPVVEAPTSAVTDVRRELQRLQDLRTRRDQSTKDGAEIAAKLETVTKTLSELPSTAAQEEEIAALKARIQNGVKLRDEAAAYYRSLDTYAKALETRQKAEEEVKRLEALVDVLGPSGARVQALGAALDVFTANITPFLEPFGWTLTFRLDPWDVLVNGRSIRTFSRSEQYRVGIALQVAIAHLSGIGFVIVDELDMLDKKNRDVMARLLVFSTLDQILMLGTREPDAALPEVKGLQVIRIGQTNGRSVIVEEVAV